MAQTIDTNDASVHCHLDLLQRVIDRMSTSSANCKTWCVALVSAIVIILAEQKQPDYVWVSLIPVVLFIWLDAYYLGWERRFRDVHDGFVAKLHAEAAVTSDLFVVKPEGSSWLTVQATFGAMWSVSTLPFYGLMVFMVLVVRGCVLA